MFWFGNRLPRQTLTFLMGTGHISQVVVVYQIIAAHINQFPIRIAQYVFAPEIYCKEKKC